MQSNTAEQVSRAAAVLANAHYACALTGAGISTPSGIPDFRSPGSGLWAQADPFEVATIYGFRTNAQAFFDWVRPLAALILAAEPNPAHVALAELSQIGVLQAIITQNIDGLHQRARSSVVHEVHGHLRSATCIRCYTSTTAAHLVKVFIKDGTIPRCSDCGAVLKPDVVLLGEQLPVLTLMAAQQAARKSDVMIVAGSSLEVAPVGDLPLLSKQGGGKLIIVNFGPTHLDHLADIRIYADVAHVLPQLALAVRNEL